LRAPFSLQKIHWNPKTRTVIYRSRRSWRTKRNFDVFQATDFLAAAIDHIPPRGQQTIRYYGLYSNKSRGMPRPVAALTESTGEKPTTAKPPVVPPPPDPPFDIDTFEPIEPPWQAIREWIPDDDAEPSFDCFDQRPDSGKPVEIRREDSTILVLDSD
jgi:hypothetical protein